MGDYIIYIYALCGAKHSLRSSTGQPKKALMHPSCIIGIATRKGIGTNFHNHVFLKIYFIILLFLNFK